MFRYEWYKLWHNRRLVGIVLLLVLLNCGYFAYREKHLTPPSDAYRALQDDLAGMSDEAASARLAEEHEALRAVLYFEEGPSLSDVKLKYCDTLWTEMSLYSQMLREYEDILTYPQYLAKVLEAPKKYQVLSLFSDVDDRMLKNVNKTAEDYEKLADLTLTHTRTRGISRALSLPSVIFLEILMAILFTSVVLIREKEQDLLSLYATMPNGRGRSMCARFGAVTLGIVIGNFVLFGSTILTGCILYGMPAPDDWRQPLQSVPGFKTAALPVNILTFLLLVYAGSCMVSVFFAMLTAFFGIVCGSSRTVYLLLFLLVGVEGILYLKIDDLSYLANWKRINLIAFSDVAGRLGHYRNLYVLDQPVNEWLVAMVSVVALGILLGGVAILLVNRGIGLAARRKGKAHATHAVLGGLSHRSHGCHESLFLHECYKYLRLERIGIVFVLLVLWVALFTKPVSLPYSIEEMHYRGYLLRLQEVSPEEYPAMIETFQAEFEEAKRTSGNQGMLYDREQALANITVYVAYLQPLDGAKAVHERVFELMYNNRRQNIIMGAGALLLVILCATSLYYIEYRTGMNEMVRISYAGKYRVHLWKILLLAASVLVILALIYGRYLYQVAQGCGTVGIREAAYSVRDLTSISAHFSIRQYIAWVCLKRFAGLLIGAAVAVLMIRKVKSFIFAVVGSVLILVLPLLLCFFEAELLDRVLLNGLFL